MSPIATPSIQCSTSQQMIVKSTSKWVTSFSGCMYCLIGTDWHPIHLLFHTADSFRGGCFIKYRMLPLLPWLNDNNRNHRVISKRGHSYQHSHCYWSWIVCKSSDILDWCKLEDGVHWSHNIESDWKEYQQKTASMTILPTQKHIILLHVPSVLNTIPLSKYTMPSINVLCTYSTYWHKLPQHGHNDRFTETRGHCTHKNQNIVVFSTSSRSVCCYIPHLSLLYVVP